MIDRAVFRVIFERGFEAGWTKSAQGFNHEHHNLTARELHDMKAKASREAADEYYGVPKP